MSDKEKSNNSYDEFAKKLLGCKNHNDLAMFLIDIVMDIPIIKKAAKRCYLDQELVLSFFSRILPKKYSSKYKIDIPRLHSVIKAYMEDDIGTGDFSFLKYTLLILESPMVDIYSIFRMFKIFNNKNNLPIKPRHIIFYAGNYHSETIRSFLKFLEFEKDINISMKKGVRCLDINGIKLDFKKLRR